MTETQAMSETAGTPADPAEQEAKKPEVASDPAGKAAVGRATVPAEPGAEQPVGAPASPVRLECRLRARRRSR
jgi:hypothetical protein